MNLRMTLQALKWLSSVISTLDSGYVGNKLELHRILVKVRTDLNNYHLQHLEDKRNIALDGDDDTGGIEMKKNPVITGLIEHLDQLLNPGHHYEGSSIIELIGNIIFALECGKCV